MDIKRMTNFMSTKCFHHFLYSNYFHSLRFIIQPHWRRRQILIHSRNIHAQQGKKSDAVHGMAITVDGPTEQLQAAHTRDLKEKSFSIRRKAPHVVVKVKYLRSFSILRRKRKPRSIFRLFGGSCAGLLASLLWMINRNIEVKFFLAKNVLFYSSLFLSNLR